MILRSRGAKAPLLSVDLMPARVALNLRESGAVFPCKWCSVAEIYTGGLDFSLIRPTGISLKLLKKMLQVGYLAKDNVQSIWRRIENTQYS